MIGQLKGELVRALAPEVLLGVGGVGYEILVPMTTYDRLPELGAEVRLWTHLVVREDAHSLYGFLLERDRVLFRTLIKVNGIGPKLALSILSSADAGAFSQLIEQEGVTQLTRIPGVGKKMAERMVLELKGKLPQAAPDAAGHLSAPSATEPPAQTVMTDAESALETLGYRSAQIGKLLQQAYKPGMSSDELIRAALKSAL